jgi:3-deoxy-D-manno-octulosonate 8-phosphate phosphatase (KDO 8-P phosphatase)
VKLLLMDVDGVMTDGRLFTIPDASGKMFETKGFDSQDGIALQWLHWYGVRTGLISGRDSPATAERAKQVKMTYVYQGHIEKIPILNEILADAKVEPDGYRGDESRGSGGGDAECAEGSESPGALCYEGRRRAGRGQGSDRDGA